MNVIRHFVVLSISLLLGACGTTRGSYVTPTMPDADFVKASSEDQAKYLKVVKDEANLLTMKKDTEYMAGRPVYYGDPGTGYTLQWNKKLSVVSFYHGHNTGTMGLDSLAFATIRTDELGNIYYQNDGSGVSKPTTLLANVATQEALGRTILKGGFQVLAGAANGVLAAKISADNDCGDGCGNISLTNVGGTNSAGSLANATSGSGVDFNATLGGCPSGNCTSVPME